MSWIKRIFMHIGKRMFILFKWILIAMIVGLCVGAAGILFYKCIQWATQTRTEHSYFIFLLPIGGLFIAWLYNFFDKSAIQGTNLVLSSIHSNKEIPIKMLPLIFVSSVITHLFGGSAGREGAALQIGGSLGNKLGKYFKLDDKDRHIIIMCGMSAAFTALFGTPMAAAIFSMEVVSVGIMHYAALVPCVIASLFSSAIAKSFGIMPEMYNIGIVPEFTFAPAVQTVLLAILCAALSVLFCILLHKTEHTFKTYIKNPYLRILMGSILIILLSVLLNTRDYNGTGAEVIHRAVSGEVNYEAFFLKMIFTAITLGTGFKGGEIVPTFFIGATFGCLFGILFDFSPSLCAAVGMISVFCGVTNCPISSLLISFELFGLEAMPYFLIAVAISYMLSGYYGLYQSQKIIYSKYKSEYINTTTHK